LPDNEPVDSTAPRPTVFLSYASEDREAARRLRDALPAYGLDVWYDESELGGGEAWDQKIRRQIRECDYFLALVSAQTEARREGYFRREWRIAVERTLDMADDHLFLLPVVIDETNQATARVPEKFLAVQWLKVPRGEPTPALENLCRRIAGGNPVSPAPPRKPPGAASSAFPPAQPPSPSPVTPVTPGAPASPASAVPFVLEFPREEPGQRLRFLLEVTVWLVRWAWLGFQKLPRWVRIIGYCWLVFFCISQCRSTEHESHEPSTAQNMEKLQAIAKSFDAGPNKSDLAKLGSAVASEFADDEDGTTTADHSPLLAVAFTAPPDDAAAQALANQSFALVYGLAVISNADKVSLSKDPADKPDLATALSLGRDKHATYVLCGRIAPIDGQSRLTVEIAKVADGSIVWSTTEPTAGVQPAKLATQIAAHLPAL